MTDSSLRDALEKLAREAGSVEHGTDLGHGSEFEPACPRCWADEIHGLLAARPAEPVGVSDEAVERATAAFVEAYETHELSGLDSGAETTAAVRSALEAAFPLLMGRLATLDKAPNNSAQVLQIAAPKTVAALLGTRPQPTLNRNAVLAVLRERYYGGVGDKADYDASVTDQIMALVRPLPTREQIMRALAGVEGRRPDDKSEVWLGAYEDVYGPRADAVLALMGGAGTDAGE